MREKVSTAYFLDDPRKFSSMEEAEKELNRLRAVCVRLKKKQGEEIAFMLGLSVTDSQYIGRMGYQKSMRYGGKKVFICTEKRIQRTPSPLAAEGNTDNNTMDKMKGETKE